MPSPRSFSNSFHLWLNLFLLILPECLNNSWWCFSSSFSNFEDWRRVPLKSLPVLPKMRSSSLMPSSHNCFRLWEFFSPIWSISWVVSISFLRRPSCHNSSFSTCSYRSPNLTGASFKCSLISSRSLRLMFLNSLKYLHSFSNSYRWFTPLLRSFSILTVVHSRFLFLRYHINSFVVSILPVVRWRPSKFALYLS